MLKFDSNLSLILLFVFLMASKTVTAVTFGHIVENYNSDPSSFVFNIVFVIFLLGFGGILAGLTIGLMTLDEVNLELLAKCGGPKDREYASKIIPIRKDGYFLLVSLLLANTVINETLPIIADDILGNGWEAIIISTFLLLVFAELIPQAACTRYGLMIGAKFVWLLRILMFIMYPIAFPIARALEYFLGKHEKSFYKRAELKELIKLMGETKIDLSADEVRMIGGVLEMREKTPKHVMTPLDEVFMISYDSKLDSELLQLIMKNGFSRVPVYKGDKTNILGMLLVKNLLSLNFDKAHEVKDLKLSPLPRFSGDHSIFSIFHEFKMGKSHMGIVEMIMDGKCIPVGILTLEDLIEELIQQEILDETDELLSEGKTIPMQATLQSYILHGIKSGSEVSTSLTSILRDEGNVSELLLENKK